MKRVLQPAGMLALTMRTFKACLLILCQLALGTAYSGRSQPIDIPKIDVPRTQSTPVPASPITIFPIQSTPIKPTPVAPTPIPPTPITLSPISSPMPQVSPISATPVIRLPTTATPGLSSGGTADLAPTAYLPAPVGGTRVGVNLTDTTPTNAAPLDAFLKFLHEPATTNGSGSNAPATEAAPIDFQPLPPMPEKPASTFINPV